MPSQMWWDGEYLTMLGIPHVCNYTESRLTWEIDGKKYQRTYRKPVNTGTESQDWLCDYGDELPDVDVFSAKR